MAGRVGLLMAAMCSLREWLLNLSILNRGCVARLENGWDEPKGIIAEERECDDTQFAFLRGLDTMCVNCFQSEPQARGLLICHNTCLLLSPFHIIRTLFQPKSDSFFKPSPNTTPIVVPSLFPYPNTYPLSRLESNHPYPHTAKKANNTPSAATPHHPHTHSQTHIPHFPPLTPLLCPAASPPQSCSAVLWLSF